MKAILNRTCSVLSLSVDELIATAHHATGSRVLDVLLESPTVSTKAKRNFVLKFIGHFHTLADDRIGSRVAERCWAYADPYLKVSLYALMGRVLRLTEGWMPRKKIARSVVPHEHFLAGSMYGKYFARKLNLHLLQRKPDQWRDQQSATKAAASHPTQSNPAQSSAPADEASASTDEPRKRKHEAAPKDEIDALFDATFGKKIKKGGLGLGGDAEEQKPKLAKSLGDEQHSKKKRKQDTSMEEDKDLKHVLGAIREAPKDDSNHRKKVKPQRK